MRPPWRELSSVCESTSSGNMVKTQPGRGSLQKAQPGWSNSFYPARFNIIYIFLSCDIKNSGRPGKRRISHSTVTFVIAWLNNYLLQFMLFYLKILYQPCKDGVMFSHLLFCLREKSKDRHLKILLDKEMHQILTSKKWENSSYVITLKSS